MRIFLAFLLFLINQSVALSEPSIGPAFIYADNGNGTYSVESGTLFCNEGFVKSGGVTVPLPIDSGFYTQIMSPDVFKAVSGKPVMGLAGYLLFKDIPGYTKCFQRSADTYSIAGNPYVALSLSAGGNGTTGGTGTSNVTRTVTIATISNPSISSNTSGEFLLALDSATSKNAVIQYKLGGTAKNGKDYFKIPTQATILAGNVSTMIKIKPKSKHGAGKTVTLTLLKPKNKKIYQLGQTTSVSMEIQN